MIIKFKNLEKSEIAREAVRSRMDPLIEKFEDLKGCRILVTLEMENSPLQAGPDHFKVKVHIANGRYRDITVEKEETNLYVALAEVAEHMLEVLNRFGDRNRVKGRKKARELVKKLKTWEGPSEEFDDEQKTG